MPELSEADSMRVTAIRGSAVRYGILSARLAATLKADGTLPNAEFEELKQLATMLAGDVSFLLSMITRLEGGIE